jgi:hypothetical protein
VMAIDHDWRVTIVSSGEHPLCGDETLFFRMNLYLFGSNFISGQHYEAKLVKRAVSAGRNGVRIVT